MTRLHDDVIDGHATVAGITSTSLYDDLVESTRQLGKHSVPGSAVYSYAWRQVPWMFPLFVNNKDPYQWFVENGRWL